MRAVLVLVAAAGCGAAARETAAPSTMTDRPLIATAAPRASVAPVSDGAARGDDGKAIGAEGDDDASAGGRGDAAPARGGDDAQAGGRRAAMPTRAIDDALAGLRREPRLDGIAAAAALAASRGYVVSTAALREATVAGLGSDLRPYLITARGDEVETDAQVAEAIGELRAAVALEAVGLATATGTTGRVVALIATPVPTVAVTRVRAGDDVTLTLPWPWPLPPRAYLTTSSRARQVVAVLGPHQLSVTVKCRGAAALGFDTDAGLEIDAGQRLIASVPAVCGGRHAAITTGDVGPPARTTVETEQRLFELVNQERAARGLVALMWDPLAHRMARDHAADMAHGGFIGHVGSTGATLTDRVLGHALPAIETFENVGRAGGPGEAHAAFMASPGHRANLLAAGARRGAIGIVPAPAPDVAGDFYVTEVLFEPAR